MSTLSGFILITATYGAQKYEQNLRLRFHSNNGYANAPQWHTLYVHYLCGYVYDWLLHTRKRTYFTAAGRAFKPISAPTVKTSAARRPPPTPPQLIAFLSPTWDPFSRSNQTSLWCPTQNLFCYRPAEPERIKRNVCDTKHIVCNYKKVHSNTVVVLSISAVPNALGFSSGCSSKTRLMNSKHFVSSLQIILQLEGRSRRPTTNSLIFKTKTE